LIPAIDCYVCGLELVAESAVDVDDKAQVDFNEKKSKLPTMTRFDGTTRPLCVPCYKNQEHGMAIWRENNPNWKLGDRVKKNGK
jgi:hypothetical protein